MFALFGKEEKVDEEWAKSMLLNYMRHYLGIRNTDVYIELYSATMQISNLFFLLIPTMKF